MEGLTDQPWVLPVFTSFWPVRWFWSNLTAEDTNYKWTTFNWPGLADLVFKPLCSKYIPLEDPGHTIFGWQRIAWEYSTTFHKRLHCMARIFQSARFPNISHQQWGRSASAVDATCVEWLHHDNVHLNSSRNLRRRVFPFGKDNPFSFQVSRDCPSQNLGWNI